jgi:Tol biopolymer transport system component
MTDPLSPGTLPPAERPSADRLDSWKEIAAYMRRDVTTVQRWEKREGMPVQRHLHDKMGSVYAFKSDLDAWAARRSPIPAADPEPEPQASDAPAPGPIPPTAPPAESRGHRGIWLTIAAGVLVAAASAWWIRPSRPAADNPLADTRFLPLTDFEGIEQAAAISRDGRFVAFLSDRDGQMDVWITQVGMGQFYNLTRGAMPELVNPSVRTLGFSPDGTLVTFWTRRSGAANAPAIGIWAVPVLGGQPRPYLEGAAELDWSGEDARLVYHTPGPGDPMFVRDGGPSSDARKIFSAPAGLHSHFLLWSPGQTFIYFVQGALPDRMDIWRIPPAGGTPEQITSHGALVSHPVFLNPQTLLYLASDADGSGPWLHSLDLEQRVSRRVTSGLDRYTSLAASADGRRLVATLANPKGILWRAPLKDAPVTMAGARRVGLTTGNGSAPRLDDGSLLYVSSKGTGDTLWRLHGDRAAELWSAPDARIVGRPAVAPDGGRVAFTVKQGERTVLVVVNADGTSARSVSGTLDVQGSPAWTPDGRAITVAVLTDGTPSLFNLPAGDGSPVPLVREYSTDPAWSPDGAFVVFSGPDIGTTFQVKAATPLGEPYPLPSITLTRGARHLHVTPGRQLAVLRGEIGHKDLWTIDLETGAERALTELPPEVAIRDFDISMDGRELVFEQVQEQSDLVLLEVRSEK